MAKFTEVDPQKLLEAKRREVEIAELEKTKAEIDNNQMLPDWRKKQLKMEVTLEIKRIKSEIKFEQLREIAKGSQ